MPQTSAETYTKTKLILIREFGIEDVDYNMDGCAERYLRQRQWRFRNGLMKEPVTWADIPEDEKTVAIFLIEEWDYAFAD